MPLLGLYIHIPFCRGKCHYCDFCSAPATPAIQERYVRALCAQLQALSASAKNCTVDTVYLGGGTPTVLNAAQLTQILSTVKGAYALCNDAEISVECNPVTGAQALFEALLKAGANRLSIGLQSIHESELHHLGRLHTFADFKHTLAAAREAGFSNISADVMLGIPAQTPASFAQTLHTLCELSPTHISAYGLRIEEGTPFWKKRDTLPIPTEEAEAEMAELVSTLLPTAGYHRYEISNYARPGFESRHNLRYWLGEDYLGFGPAAHSFFHGVRFACPPDTAAYVRLVEQGDFNALATERHRIEKAEAREEYVMLRMRLSRGVSKTDFQQRFGARFEDVYGDYSALLTGGFLTDDGTHVAFTDRGMQVSNAILSQWLDFGGIE